MRLIDEKQLVITGDCKEIDGELYIKVSDVERCLENAPTAYDIDKVVEQLKIVEVLDNAIEIVESGGKV